MAALRDLVGQYVQEWYPLGSEFSVADQELLASLPQHCTWPDGAALLAVTGNTPTGCVLIAPSEDPSTGLLRKLFVCPEARGTGTGTALLAAAYDVASDLGLRRLALTVHPERTAAISLYLRDGFIDQGLDLDGFMSMVRSA